MAIRVVSQQASRGSVHGRRQGRIDKRLHRWLLMILDAMNGPESLADVASLPGFHPLAGDRRGRYAVTVTGNYRATFRLEKRNIYDVHFLDYH